MRSITSSKKSFSGFSWYICSCVKRCTRAATQHFSNLSNAHCFCKHLDHVGALRCADECKRQLHDGVTARGAGYNVLHLPLAGEIEAFLGCLEVNWGTHDTSGRAHSHSALRSILLATTMQGMDGRFSCSSAYHFDRLVYVTFLVMSNT